MEHIQWLFIVAVHLQTTQPCLMVTKLILFPDIAHFGSVMTAENLKW